MNETPAVNEMIPIILINQAQIMNIMKAFISGNHDFSLEFKDQVVKLLDTHIESSTKAVKLYYETGEEK